MPAPTPGSSLISLFREKAFLSIDLFMLRAGFPIGMGPCPPPPLTK